MCKGVWLNQKTSPVVVELPVERVGEHLRLVAARLQEKSTLDCGRIISISSVHLYELIQKIYLGLTNAILDKVVTS